ncbi:hypothetical protein JB92DRAFT_2746923 [Gautieria morchelliformis]|nr:hypothetical protein JB92DRAFT_2746923 [Gautieria morchelliformis]
MAPHKKTRKSGRARSSHIVLDSASESETSRDTGASTDHEAAPVDQAPKSQLLSCEEAFEKRFKASEHTNEEVRGAYASNPRSLSTYSCVPPRCADARLAVGLLPALRLPPAIIEKGSKVMYKFTCKRNPSKSITRNRTDESTSNLQRHVNECSPVKSSETHVLAAYANGTTYSSARMCFLLAKWCAHNHRPCAIIEDEELIQIFKMLYGRVDILSRMTLSQDIHEVFDFLKAHVSRGLGWAHVGKIHLAVDGWTSPNVYYVPHHPGLYQVCVPFFSRLMASHTGVYLAEQLVACLKDYGIKKKVSTSELCMAVISLLIWM